MDGCAAERTPEGETASLTTATAALTVPRERVLLVHQTPDDSCREERNRHRHEDDDLESDREANALEKHGEDETDRSDEHRHDQEPQEVVLDRRDERVVGEERLVVVEPDELAPVTP